MSHRDDIAAAASTVDGITCTPFYRQTTKPGDAMVRLDHVDYPDPFGGIVTWQVLVILPADIAQAEAWLQARQLELVNAIAPELVVRKVTPSQLQLDSGLVPCVVIEGTREEE